MHRDSNGVKQCYGGERHSQWMVAGAGILHEEMWDIPSMGGKQELYQLWINLPAKDKLATPRCVLLGGEENEEGATPTVYDNVTNSNTIVLCGEYNGKKAGIQPYSSMNIFHVILGKSWDYTIPPNHETVIIYVRKGSISIDNTVIPTHSTAFLSTSGSSLTIVNANTNTNTEEADFFLLSGEPLNENIASQGSMVMNTDYEIQQAYQDYSMGRMGVPWDHTLSDEQWMDHVQKFPSSYK